MLTLLMLSLLAEPAAMPNIDATRTYCDPGVVHAQFPSQRRLRPIQAETLVHRPAQQQEVRRYLLLDRRDRNNCPLPISYPIPGQPQALGRELGREPQPLPRATPPARPSMPVAPGN